MGKDKKLHRLKRTARKKKMTKKEADKFIYGKVAKQ